MRLMKTIYLIYRITEMIFSFVDKVIYEAQFDRKEFSSMNNLKKKTETFVLIAD